jgi:hypothetical protein
MNVFNNSVADYRSLLNVYLAEHKKSSFASFTEDEIDSMKLFSLWLNDQQRMERRIDEANHKWKELSNQC